MAKRTLALPAPAPDRDAFEAAVSRTLQLMSCYAGQPELALGEVVAAQLAALSRHPLAGPQLRAHCEQLFLHWLGPLQPQDLAPPNADAAPRAPAATRSALH